MDETYGDECSRQEEECHEGNYLHGDGFLLRLLRELEHGVRHSFHAICGELGALGVDSATFHGALVGYLVDLFCS